MQDLLYITAPILFAIIPLAVFLTVMEFSRSEGRTVSRLKGQRAFGVCGACTATILALWSAAMGEFSITLMAIGLLMFFAAIAVISDALLSVEGIDPTMLVGGKCRVYTSPRGRCIRGKEGRTRQSRVQTPPNPRNPLENPFWRKMLK